MNDEKNNFFNELLSLNQSDEKEKIQLGKYLEKSKLDLSLKNELIKNSIKNEELEALAKYDQQKGVNHESKKK